MVKYRPILLVLAGVALLTLATAQDINPVVVLTVEDAIGPATSDYLHRGLERATERNASLVVIQLDTPGGLDVSMRSIIRDIIASPVPVAVYVAPAGARAASAGTYILYAAHIAAMAPATNVGAATPVPIGGLPDFEPGDQWRDKEGREKGKSKEQNKAKKNDKESISTPGNAMTKKLVNDAVAYIRSLAQMRGRNAEWAEKAVREGVSLSAEEALAQDVIDVVAVNLQELLNSIDGRKVNVQGLDRQLHTKGIFVESIEPDWRSRLLGVITNPNVAYILMLLGIYGLFFELASPGYILPGVVGAISMLLALYAFQVLPVNYAGLALILLGIAFMVAELFVSSFGVLGIGGIIAFVIGSVILFDTGVNSYYTVSIPLIGGVALLTAGFLMGTIGMAFRVHRRPVVSGREQMLGSLGEASEDFSGSGWVHAHGESWRAYCATPLKRGQRVRITGLQGLTLIVEPVQEDH